MKAKMNKTQMVWKGIAALTVMLSVLGTSLDAQVTVTKNRDVSCGGEADGSATATVSGGTPPYSYQWSNGETTATASHLPAGTHTCVVKDAHECESQGSVNITEPPPLKLEAHSAGHVTYPCGQSPPPTTLSASASGGEPPYNISPGNGSVTVYGSATITFTVTDANNCTKAAQASVVYSEDQCSHDPNDITGPKGWDDERWIPAGESMPFRIRYENSPDFATAAAQKVSIELPIDSNLNMYSFRLGDFGFGLHFFQVPQNSTFYYQRLDLVDSLGVYVDVLAGLDVNARKAFWSFESVDSATGLPPADPALGYLPVNDSITHAGEGFVYFDIEPAGSLVSGDSILAEASIVFDINQPIATNVWRNTIDALPPTTHVNPVHAVQDSAAFVVSFTTSDDPGGSGVRHVELFVSKNSGPYVTNGTFPPDTTAIFLGNTGSYTFYSIGTDYAGNEEAPKTQPEASVIILDSLQFMVSGKVYYGTVGATPLSGLMISRNSSIAINLDTASTDGSGYYEFMDVGRGKYYLKTSSSRPWAGVNATDALKISKYTVGLDSLPGLKLKAGDVNASGVVNSTDALMIKQRVIGLINSFSAGDWVFETDTFTITNDTLEDFDYTGLVVGDVNISYNPLQSRLSPSLNLVREGVMKASAGAAFELPVYLSSQLDVAAITLFLEFNPKKMVIEGVRTPIGEVQYNVQGRHLKIAFDNLVPIQAGPAQPLLVIRMRTSDEFDFNDVLPINLEPGSEIADFNANVLSGQTLRIPNLDFTPQEFILHQNIPNPFRGSTLIRYELPEEGMVSIQLLNAVGQVVAEPVSQYQHAGRYEFSLNGNELPAGFYQCRMVARSPGADFSQTIKLIHFSD